MKTRILTVLALSGLVVSACADASRSTGPSVAIPRTSVSSTATQAGPFVAGRVLARFAPGASGLAIAAAHGASVERDIAFGIRILSVPVGRELQIAQALSANPNVQFAEPDYLRTFGTPTVMPVNDPFSGYKWDLDNDGKIYNSSGTVLATTGRVDADMDWKEAYAHLGGSVSGSVVIGIIDTGIRADHEELASRLKAQHDFFAGDADAADDNGHGTHVAGIAAAAANNGRGVPGVSFANTQFAIAKVCGRTFPFGYGCPLSAIADGIKWAVDNGAHVLNISLGGASGSSTEQSALQYARSRNVLPFCAAGNESGAVSYPAAFPECVAVSATDWGDNLASYSNFGPQIVLAAPGGDDENSNGYSYILSSYYESATSYVFMSGTSMAAPQATGLAALLHTLGITDDDAKLTRLASSADDLGASGRDNQFGYGRINAYLAVTGGSSGGNNPPPAGITLSARGYKAKGTWQVDLTWAGATSTTVDVFRNGARIITTGNDGAYTDRIGKTVNGSYRYRVCEAGTSTCSNEVTVTFS